MPIVPQNAATTPAKKRLKQQSAWQTPFNCRHFHDNLCQIQFSDCSALPESRLQSLAHPYSPLKASAFFRISRNPGPGKLSISQKSFGMKDYRNVKVDNGPVRAPENFLKSVSKNAGKHAYDSNDVDCIRDHDLADATRPLFQQHAIY